MKTADARRYALDIVRLRQLVTEAMVADLSENTGPLGPIYAEADRIASRWPIWAQRKLDIRTRVTEPVERRVWRSWGLS